MKYPFEFNEMILTDRVLTLIGFSLYHDGPGDFGFRYLKEYCLIEIDEKDDGNDGYILPAQYCPSKYQSGNNYQDIYFLHDLYEDIKCNKPEILDYFISKVKENNMYPYLESYINNIYIY